MSNYDHKHASTIQSRYGKVPPCWTDTVYTGPMHPQVRDTANNACPICGMSLEPETVGNELEDTSEFDEMRRRF